MTRRIVMSVVCAVLLFAAKPAMAQVSSNQHFCPNCGSVHPQASYSRNGYGRVGYPYPYRQRFHQLPVRPYLPPQVPGMYPQTRLKQTIDEQHNDYLYATRPVPVYYGWLYHY